VPHTTIIHTRSYRVSSCWCVGRFCGWRGDRATSAWSPTPSRDSRCDTRLSRGYPCATQLPCPFSIQYHHYQYLVGACVGCAAGEATGQPPPGRRPPPRTPGATHDYRRLIRAPHGYRIHFFLYSIISISTLSVRVSGLRLARRQGNLRLAATSSTDSRCDTRLSRGYMRAPHAYDIPPSDRGPSLSVSCRCVCRVCGW
jgi:hypothetical protein